MGYRLLADALVLLHAGFILFVVGGSFLVLWKRWILWLHLPACLWGALIEFYGWVCPLTPWEQALRARAGQGGYTGGFIDHYLVPLIYPSALTRRGQLLIGVLVVLLNAASYVVLWSRFRRVRAVRPGV
jgi:hypothetical protein